MRNMHKNGYILLEVMVAVSILAAGIVSVLSIHFKSMANIERITVISRANLLMEREIALIQTTDYHEISDYEKNYEEDEGFFTFQIFVTDETVLHCKKIEISLSWGQKQGQKIWSEEIIKCDLSNDETE